MTTIKEWYERVNNAWPAAVPIPTDAQAVNAAKRLHRWATGETWAGPIKVTSGRRYTWIRRGVLTVNPNRPGREGGGWKALIHDLGHLFWWKFNRGEARPHERGHAKLELALIKEVLRRGWLEAETPQSKPKPDVRLERFERIKARMDAWERKERRAKNAIKKLRRQASYYESRLSA